MGRFGDQIAALPLYRLLLSKGKNGGSSDVMKLAGMVIDAADVAGPLLANIPVTFKQYTVHDIAHTKNLIELMGRFIPKKTQKAMSAVEVAVLMLSALLHDLGMYVTEEEKDDVLTSFSSFLAASPETGRALNETRAGNPRGVQSAIEDAALADYFRKRHPDRAGLNIDRYFGGKFTFNDIDLAPWIKKICEGHRWPVYTSNDPAHPDHAIARALKPSDPVFGIPFHPQYIACCLRLADIMDFDRSRMPLALLRTINDETSQFQWQKRLQLTGWAIDEHNVEFHASCTHPEHYVALMEFLDFVSQELLECRCLIVRDSTPQTSNYTLHLPSSVDRVYVQMADRSYAPGDFRLEFNYDQALELLITRTQHYEPNLFLQELLHNSIDACRLRNALAQEEGTAHLYTPSIIVWDNSSDEPDPTVVFQDNGVGMSEEVVKNHFMRIGSSYYQSSAFHALRGRLARKGIPLEITSQLGLGFLLGFMIARRVEIDTYCLGETPLHVEIERHTKHFAIRRLPKPESTHAGTIQPVADGPPLYAGTRITLHLQAGTAVNITESLRRFASEAGSEVTVIARLRSQVALASARKTLLNPFGGTVSLDTPAAPSDIPKQETHAPPPSARVRRLQVFLCHASEDKAAVRKLYDALKPFPVALWLDDVELLPGQNWEKEIRRALRNADVVIVCLSTHAVTKTGFVQKEITLALDIAGEQPEGSIFIIPARLEDCAVLTRLEELQRVDLFEPTAMSRLIASLERRARELNIPWREERVPSDPGYSMS